MQKAVISCDLCGQAAPCLQKQIDGKEFDLCDSCWGQLAARLRGKGRAPGRELEEYDEISTY